jgi:hypothetical protein
MPVMRISRLARAPPFRQCKRLSADVSPAALRRMSDYPFSASCRQQYALHPPRSTEVERESLSLVYRMRSSRAQ